MFDRTPSSEIIVPGRWWLHMCERLSDTPGVDSETAQTTLALAQALRVEDAILPSDFETVEVLLVNEFDQPVKHEALPPGTRMRLDVRLSLDSLGHGSDIDEPSRP
jgi:hypothetical protein